DVLAAADDHVLDPVADLGVTVGVHDRGVTGVEPTVAHHLLGCLGIVVVTLHDHVAAGHDLAQRLAVGRDVLAVAVDAAQLAGADHLPAGQRLDHRAVGRRHRTVLWAALAHGGSSRRLREPL